MDRANQPRHISQAKHPFELPGKNFKAGIPHRVVAQRQAGNHLSGAEDVQRHRGFVRDHKASLQDQRLQA